MSVLNRTNFEQRSFYTGDLEQNRRITMLSTVDWEDEVTTKSPTEYFSSETSARGSRASNAAIPYNITLAVIGVLGILTNGLVLGGFWHAGRSKMNASSAHIANHTTLEQSSCS